MAQFTISDHNKIYELSLLHIGSKIIGLAAEIRLDKILSEVPSDINEISKQVGFHPNAMCRILRVLEANEIVELLDNNRVKAGKLLPYLDRIISPHILDSYHYINDLPFSIHDNRECYSKTFGKAFYPHLVENPKKLEQFKRWCTESAKEWLPAVFSLYDFSKFDTVVDVGGGEGYFLASILAKHNHQKGILLDQPEVIERATTTFEEHHVNDRAQAFGGDFFKSIPVGGDVYIICRTLLNWDDSDALKIINNCHNVMKPNSTLLIIDFVIPDKNHPQYKVAALNDINLLACLNSANRTEAEWRNLIEKSKFTLKSIYISPPNIEPQPIIPLIILEAIAM